MELRRLTNEAVEVVHAVEVASQGDEKSRSNSAHVVAREVLVDDSLEVMQDESSDPRLVTVAELEDDRLSDLAYNTGDMFCVPHTVVGAVILDDMRSRKPLQVVHGEPRAVGNLEVVAGNRGNSTPNLFNGHLDVAVDRVRIVVGTV